MFLDGEGKSVLSAQLHPVRKQVSSLNAVVLIQQKTYAHTRESKLSLCTHIFFAVQTKLNAQFLVAMRLGVTPVLIPNTMVKTKTADGTVLETIWESRWLPESNLFYPMSYRLQAVYKRVTS